MLPLLKTLDLNRSRDQIMDQLNRVQKRFPDLAIDNFDEMVMTGKLQVFPCGSISVMVGKACDDNTVWIVAAAGNLDELLDFEPHFCQWYADRGFETAYLRGRTGWQKTLRDKGWRFTDFESELSKDLRGL